MKFTYKILVVLILTFASISISSFAQVNKNLLLGKWLFVTYTMPAKSATTDEFICESNKKYKDVIYIFTKNQFEMKKKNGGKDWNKKTQYKLVDDKYIQLSVGQKIRIDYLDAHTLKLFVEGSKPTGIFKRI